MYIPGIILALGGIEMNKTKIALPSWNLHSLEEIKTNKLIILSGSDKSAEEKMEDYKTIGSDKSIM